MARRLSTWICTLWAAALLVSCQGGDSPSALPANAGAGGSIVYSPSALQVRYGEYTEAAFALSSPSGAPVDWEVLDSAVPAGLELRDTGDSSVVLAGSPLFTDEWCFVLSVRSGSEALASTRICMNSEENPSLGYPRFRFDRQLPFAFAHKWYEQRIDVDPASTSPSFSGTLFSGNLPSGVEVRSEPRSYRFLVSGVFDRPGFHRMVLRLVGNSGYPNFRQFEIHVEEQDMGPGTGGGATQCPAGYYFDSVLGHCVQNGSTSCPNGSYFNPELNQCVAYPAPPSGFVCGPGSYFDHFLSRCVAYGVPRCPLNYEWSDFHRSCVRSPYTCSVGERYDWGRRQCVPMWNVRCPSGFHFDAFVRQCVRDQNSCPWGQFWDPRAGRCVQNGHGCGPGEYWSPSDRRCLRDRPSCPPGYRFDFSQRSCVRETPPEHSCGMGFHWSPRHQRCMPNQGHGPGPGPRPGPGGPRHVVDEGDEG